MLTADQMLAGYAQGIFPMAESRRDPALHWVDPRRRGIFPLDGFHVSRSLARRIRHGGFDVRIDSAFTDVVAACAARPETWINPTLERLYEALFQQGHAHSLEIWSGGRLTGGVFGVSLGAAFFGESMFSRERDASKLALAYLVRLLSASGFVLFDTQFLTPHLKSLGAIEISRAEYHTRLRAALQRSADFATAGVPCAQDVMQPSTQTS